MLLQLWQLSFAEITGPMSEKGYCYFRAVLYSKTDDHYLKLASIDTVVVVKAMDVTKKMFSQGSKTITDFISKNLSNKGDNLMPLDYLSIVKADSIEKRSIRIYNTNEFVNGLYYSYKSFKTQTPEKDIEVTTKKDGSIASVKIPGSVEKVKPKDAFAIVYNGIPYIATDYGYYRLYKNSDDFYFYWKSKSHCEYRRCYCGRCFFLVCLEV